MTTQNAIPHTIAVVGAGSIGVAWTIVFARSGRPVHLYDPDAARRDVVRAEIAARLDDLASFDLFKASDTDALLARVSIHGDLAEALAGADYVQENAPENLDIKQTVFSDLETHSDTGAILASSSSFIAASRFAGHLKTKARCLVVHPGNPPFLVPVVEIVPAPFTAPDVSERTHALHAACGMSPVIVRKEVEGFVFNRLQGAMLREAYCLVRDGVIGVDELDTVVRDGLGLRWAVIGPFETVDLNTRGGVEAHAARMGPSYARMGAERGQNDPWTPDLVAKVAAERRALVPLDQWEDRVRWRDRALMTILAARRSTET